MGEELAEFPAVEAKPPLTVLNQVLVPWNDWLEVAPDEGKGNVYDHYPRLFANAFPDVDEAALELLSRGSCLLATSNFLIDHAVDGDRSTAALDNVSVPIRYTILMYEAYTHLARLFPEDTTMWDRMRPLVGRFLAALQFQAPFVSGVRDLASLSTDEAMTLARNKAAMAEFVPLAMGILGGDPELGEHIARSVTAYNTGLCLMDDVIDWRDDLFHRRPNLVVAATLRATGRTLGETGAQALSEEEMSLLAWDVLHGAGVIDVAERASAAFNSAVAICDGIDVPEWKRLIQTSRESNAELLHALPRASDAPRPPARLVIRFPALTPGDTLGRLARSAGRWLLEEVRAGFPSTEERVDFPTGHGFHAEKSLRVGEVFTRAVVANALTVFDSYLGSQLHPLLLLQRSQILARGRLDEAGPWSYFESPPERVPDADNLSEIIRFLCVTGLPAGLESTCRRSLDLITSGDRCGEGAFETWVIDPTSPTAAAQRAFVEEVWGVRSDLEVVANTVDALGRLDPKSYGAAIGLGRAFVAGCQQDDGSWVGEWYIGPYWATRVATRALPYRHHRDGLDRALAFLAASQNADGGWGSLPGEPSTSLATALALLTGAEGLADVEEAAHPNWQKAADFLMGARGEEGSWPADPLIAMDTGRARGIPGLVLRWGNRAVTTALVAQAASAWATQLQAVPRRQRGWSERNRDTQRA